MKTNGKEGANEPRQQTSEIELQSVEQLMDYLRSYAKEKPEMAALW